MKWKINNWPDGVPLRPIDSPILRQEVGVDTAVVVVLVEHGWVGPGVSEGEMSEHLVIHSPGRPLTPGVGTVPGVVGNYGSTMEVSWQHEGILENPVHHGPRLRLDIVWAKLQIFKSINWEVSIEVDIARVSSGLGSFKNFILDDYYM